MYKNILIKKGNILTLINNYISVMLPKINNLSTNKV